MKHDISCIMEALSNLKGMAKGAMLDRRRSNIQRKVDLIEGDPKLEGATESPLDNDYDEDDEREDTGKENDGVSIIMMKGTSPRRVKY